MLDPIGEHQAVQLGIRYRRAVRNASRPVELVVSSPLTRCMQTAHYAFGIGASSEHQFPTAAPPMLVHDDLREATGEYYSDKRRTKTELKESFPSFDFDDDMVEEDGLWRLVMHDKEWWGVEEWEWVVDSTPLIASLFHAPFSVVCYLYIVQYLSSRCLTIYLFSPFSTYLLRSDKRESMTEISRRISKFFAWLGDRPETKIAVVTHGLIIETAIRKYCPKYLPGRTRVLTCDVYRCSCIGVAHDDERMDVSGCIIQKAVLQSNLSRAQDDERDYDTNING